MLKYCLPAALVTLSLASPAVAQSQSTVTYAVDANQNAQRELVHAIRPGNSTSGKQTRNDRVSEAILLLRQRDYDRAYAMLYAAARDGDGQAMREIGWMYANASGVAANPAKALGWFQEAALAGDHASMLIFGTALARGLNIDRQPDVARYWLEQARRSQSADIVREAEKELSRL